MDRAQIRRATFRALATDPSYQPLRDWYCVVCRASSPRTSESCLNCDAPGPLALEVDTVQLRGSRMFQLR